MQSGIETKGTVSSKRSLEEPERGAVIPVKIQAEWLPEPLLGFAGDRVHVDVKTGMARYGPASLGTSRHPDIVRLGYIGTGKSIRSAQNWFDRASAGVKGDPARKLPDFPGFSMDRGFFSQLIHAEELCETITQNELASLKKIPKVSDRFSAAIDLISEHTRVLTTQDNAPTVVVLALPDEMVELCRTVKFRDAHRGLVQRDLRRALKAELMRHKVPTQILLQRVSEAEPDSLRIDHPSRVAWNLFTSLFYKSGGIPWKPVGLRADTCYIGISFHRPIESADTTLRSSIAQAFDEEGTGLVLRGPDFQWNSDKDGPSPHLSADQAKALLELVLRRYCAEAKRPPARVVVHKTSRYWREEQEGFQDALSEIAEFDLVAVAPTSEIRLLRSGNYPPLRGTLFRIGKIAYLYTTGYIPALHAYPHGHVPAPLQISDHFGDSSLQSIANEILILSKMNWNSAGFAGALPITIRFSRRVGDIMREVPLDREPMPQFKYYT